MALCRVVGSRAIHRERLAGKADQFVGFGAPVSAGPSDVDGSPVSARLVDRGANSGVVNVRGTNGEQRHVDVAQIIRQKQVHPGGVGCRPPGNRSAVEFRLKPGRDGHCRRQNEFGDDAVVRALHLQAGESRVEGVLEIIRGTGLENKGVFCLQFVLIEANTDRNIGRPECRQVNTAIAVVVKQRGEIQRLKQFVAGFAGRVQGEVELNETTLPRRQVVEQAIAVQIRNATRAVRVGSDDCQAQLVVNMECTAREVHERRIADAKILEAVAVRFLAAVGKFAFTEGESEKPFDSVGGGCPFIFEAHPNGFRFAGTWFRKRIDQRNFHIRLRAATSRHVVLVETRRTARNTVGASPAVLHDSRLGATAFQAETLRNGDGVLMPEEAVRTEVGAGDFERIAGKSPGRLHEFQTGRCERVYDIHQKRRTKTLVSEGKCAGKHLAVCAGIVPVLALNEGNDRGAQVVGASECGRLRHPAGSDPDGVAHVAKVVWQAADAYLNLKGKTRAACQVGQCKNGTTGVGQVNSHCACRTGILQPQGQAILQRTCGLLLDIHIRDGDLERRRFTSRDVGGDNSGNNGYACGGGNRK